MGCTLLFAVGAWPPHDGVRKARRLNLFHDLVDLSADGFETLNEIILPFVPTGTICFTFQANLFSRQRPLAFSRSRPIGGRSRLFAEVEFGFVAPHPMQNDREFACDGDARTRHAAAFGELQAPGAQA